MPVSKALIFFVETELFEVEMAVRGVDDGFEEMGRLLLEVVPQEKMKNTEIKAVIINRCVEVGMYSSC